MTGFNKSYAFKSHIISNDTLFVSPFICPKINDLEKYKENIKLGTLFDSFSYRYCQRHYLD